MNFRKLIIFLGILFAVFIACKQSVLQRADYEPKLVEKEVLQMLNEYYEVVRKDGVLAEFRYLDSSSDFFWVPPGHDGPIFIDSVRTVLTSMAPVIQRMDNSWETLIVHPINNQTAAYSGKIRSTVTDTTGNSSTMVLLETGIVVKRKDGWKLVAGQTSLAGAN